MDDLEAADWQCAIRRFYLNRRKSMKRKTYGVSGLMDLTMQIKAGKGSVSVHFSGGALTAYGVTPARYSTDNTFFQNVIEGSEQFKSGRIELLSEVEVPDNAAEKLRKARAAQRTNKVAEEKPAEEEASGYTASHPGNLEGEQKEALVVSVADKGDAIEYLKEHFDASFTSVKLRTKSAFDAACRECGVVFEFTK